MSAQDVINPAQSLPPAAGPQPLPPSGPESPREQLARQIATAGGPGGAAASSTSDGSLFSQLSKNPFFTAGFGLAGLGVVLAWGQRGLRLGVSLLRRRLLVDVEITRHDESYQWFLQWMTAYQRAQLEALHQPAPITTRLLRKLTPGMHHLSMQTSTQTLPNGSAQTRFSLVPGPGHHILRYKRAFIAVHRERDAKNIDLRTGSPFETVRLTTLYSQRHVFESLFSEAHALARRAHEGKTTIYTSWSTEWRAFGEPKRKRPLESVVLDSGIKERLVADIKAFLDARTWYLDRGIPYRRGYLLYGPPGTGKSSFIQALAGHLDFNIAILNLSERGLTDDRLMHLLTNVPQRTIVLLEDADAAFANRRAQADEHGYRGANVTFSGLLNALDGVVSAEERVVFLTTNHVERLDEALVRPGRVDMAVRLGEASREQVEMLWERFYGDLELEGTSKEEKDALKDTFVMQLKNLGLLGKVSTAALQGVFLMNKGDPRGAISMAGVLGLDLRSSERESAQENEQQGMKD